MNKHKAFLIEMPDPEDKEGMAAFYDLMNGIHEHYNQGAGMHWKQIIFAICQDATIEYIKKLAKELDVSGYCASDVYYLRTRSRHTPELEIELINLHKNGTPPPNILNWP